MRTMKRLAVFILVGFLIISFVSCEEEEENKLEDEEDEDEDVVVVLNKDNFDSFIDETETALVEFYAPWCGHCQQLAPEYEAAAKELVKNDPPVILAKVDATVETELSQKFEVSGYPTLKLFKKGTAFEYDGPRDRAGIVSYMKNRASKDWKPEPEAVIVLTKDNFTEVIEREELMLVEFYAPWCGHCKQLAPKYELAAKNLKSAENPILLAKVDATQETDLASQYGVTGYPTLKVFRKGQAFEYKGRKEPLEIVNYMNLQRGDPAKIVIGLKGLESFLGGNDVAILGIFNSGKDPRLQIYQEAVQAMRDDFSYLGFTVDRNIINHYKVKPGSLLVFNGERYSSKYEPKWHVFEIKSDTPHDAIAQFIKDHELPLVGSFEDPLQQRYNKRSPLCLIFFTVDWSFDHRDATQLWRNKIVEVAKDFRDITFAIADEEVNSQMIKEFGLEDSPEEINIGILADGKKYRMEPMEEYEEEEFREFLTRFKKGKLKPQVKSQPEPKKQSGPVTVVVGNTFDKIVRDPKKDVLIEMYAPWCGHCKQLEPVYKDLAKKLKSVKNLVIAKLDATANDVPDSYKVDGFPTIYFAPTNNKDSPIKYDGGRTLEDFVSFLKEKATVSLSSLKDEL